VGGGGAGALLRGDHLPLGGVESGGGLLGGEEQLGRCVVVAHLLGVRGVVADDQQRPAGGHRVGQPAQHLGPRPRLQVEEEGADQVVGGRGRGGLQQVGTPPLDGAGGHAGGRGVLGGPPQR